MTSFSWLQTGLSVAVWPLFCFASQAGGIVIRSSYSYRLLIHSKRCTVSCLKNGKQLLETRGNMPSNLQKTAHQKTLNLKRNSQIFLLVNEGKLSLHTGTKSLKKWSPKPHDFFIDTRRPFLNNKTKDANPIFLEKQTWGWDYWRSKASYWDSCQLFLHHCIWYRWQACDQSKWKWINNSSSVQMIETIYSSIFNSFICIHVNHRLIIRLLNLFIPLNTAFVLWVTLVENFGILYLLMLRKSSRFPVFVNISRILWLMVIIQLLIPNVLEEEEEEEYFIYPRLSHQAYL